MAQTLTERDIQQALYRRHRSTAQIMLPNYTPPWWYECDLFVVTKAFYSIEYEIKLTLSDFKADVRKTTKHKRLAGEQWEGWPASKQRPTRFFYVTPEGLVSAEDVPDYAGLVWFRRICADSPGLLRTRIRSAPRLKGERLTDKTIEHMKNMAYGRFWSDRLAFDNYRRSVTLAEQGNGTDEH